MDALAQVVQCSKVFAPVGVDALQQHHAFELREVLLADLLDLCIERGICSGNDLVHHVIVGDGTGRFDFLFQWQLDVPIRCQGLFESGQIPLLLDGLGWHMLARQIGKAALAQRGDLRRQVFRVEDVVALLVDHLALVVGDVVVLQQLLAHVEVARLDLALRALDAARDNARLDRLAIGHLEAVHDRLDTIAGKDAHQRIVQAQEEAGRSVVALSARATAQLVVDPA